MASELNAHKDKYPTDNSTGSGTPTPGDVSDNLELKREPIPKWRLITILTSIGVGLFLSLMDTTVVATMVTSISDEFDAFNLAPWVLLSYTLSYLGCTVLVARLSDVVGRKPVLISTFAAFLVSSVACGSAATVEQLIGFRAVQGIGGAGLYSMTMIIYPEISPPSLVPMLSGIIGIIVALAGVGGPILGGLLATYADWRWAFWINGPVAIIPVICLFLAWPKSMYTFKTTSLKHVDCAGALLLMAAPVLLVFGINQATIGEYAWSSPKTIIILIVSGTVGVILLWWQRHLARSTRLRHIQAQVPWRLLSHRVLMSGTMSTLLTGFVMYVVIVNIPLRAQIANLYDEVESGILLLPLMGATAVGSGLGGAVSSKQNHTFWTLVAASLLMLVGCVAMSTLPDTVEVAAAQWGFEALLGFGIGLNLSTSTLITSLNAEFKDFAVAQGLVAQMRVLGGSLGVAASFILLNKKVGETLAAVLTADEMAQFYRSPSVTRSLDVTKQLSVRTTYMAAFQANMYMCVGISAASLVASLCTYQKEPPSVKKRLKDLEALYAQPASTAL